MPSRSDVGVPDEIGPLEGDLSGWLERGREALQERHFEAATAAFERVLAHDPGRLGGLIGLAWARRSLGDRPGALDAFRLALETSPDDPKLLRHVIREARALCRWEEALRLADQARTRVPDDPWFALVRAQVLDELDPTLGSEAWREAERLAPDEPGVALGMARVAHRNHEPERAVIVLQRVAGLRSDVTQLLLELASSQLEIGRGEAALAALDELASADRGVRSDSRQLRRATDLRVRAHLLLGEPVAAATALQVSVEALGDGAGSAWAATWRGEIAAASWDLHAADEHFARALSSEPTLLRAKRLAQVRLAALDAEGARDAWRIGTALSQEQRGGRAPDVPWRVSAGLIGDLINEFLLEPGLTAEARRAVLADDVVAARALVRRAPDAQAAATALLVVLRRTGALDDPGRSSLPRAGQGPIPRRIWQAWLGSSVPGDVQRLVSRWRDTHGDWEHVLLDDRGARDLIRERGSREEAEAFASARNATALADLMRLVLLDEHGGFWVDADDLPLAPLDPLGMAGNLVVSQEPFGAVGNHLLGATAAHSVVRAALGEVIENLRAGARESLWLATGPGPLTRALARELARLEPGASSLPERGEANQSAMTVLREHERMQVVSGFRRLSYKSSSTWWRSESVPTEARSTHEAGARPRDLVCLISAGLGDALREIGTCLLYAQHFGRRLVLHTDRVRMPLPFSECFDVRRASKDDVEIILDLSEWLVPMDVTVHPAAATQLLWRLSKAARQVATSGVGASALDRIERPEAPLTFAFLEDHHEEVLFHDRLALPWSKPRVEGNATDALKRLVLRSWLSDEVRERLAVLPPGYAGIHIRNTDIRSNHVPFLLNLRQELAGRDVLVCSDDAGSIEDSRLLLQESRVFQVSRPEQVFSNSLHTARHRDPRRSAVDLFADLFALSGATDLRLCPPRKNSPSAFANVVLQLHRDPIVREAVLGSHRPWERGITAGR